MPVAMHQRPITQDVLVVCLLDFSLVIASIHKYCMYHKLCSCEKNIYDNIDIEISISQQRASITSTALVLTIQL